MIVVDALFKCFGALRAVDGVSFEAREGEIFGFLGPNGAGKTTTISMIAGLLKPDAGNVRIGEIDVWVEPNRAKRILGLAPQDLALYEDLSASENLRFWGGLYGLSGKELRARADELLARVGLADRAREAVKRFSGGMKRRLNLAAAMMHRPRFLLLDEPTAGVDPQARNAILDLVREIAREGAAILYTTHQLYEVEQICSCIAIMDHGRILKIGSMEELARSSGGSDLISIKGSFGATRLHECLADAPVQVLQAEDGSASLRISEDGFNLSALLQRLRLGEIEFTELTMQKPTLESVFLQLTGRELRD